MRSLFVLLALIVASAINADNSPYIAELELTLSQGQKLPLTEKISFEITSTKSEKLASNLASWQHITTEQLGGNRLRIEMDSQYPFYVGQRSAQYSATSFVIDLEEDSTQQFTSAFETPGKDLLTARHLEAYVSEFIDKPTYIHGFNIASKVARQRSGDCTEHAVLTTALARSINIPARVMIGTVIVEENEKVAAYGHAWTEIWLQEKWQIVDSALYGSEAKKHFYLPAAALDKESPGYIMSMTSAVSLMPEKITELKNVQL